MSFYSFCLFPLVIGLVAFVFLYMDLWLMRTSRHFISICHFILPSRKVSSMVCHNPSFYFRLILWIYYLVKQDAVLIYLFFPLPYSLLLSALIIIIILHFRSKSSAFTTTAFFKGLLSWANWPSCCPRTTNQHIKTRALPPATEYKETGDLCSDIVLPRASV